VVTIKPKKILTRTMEATCPSHSRTDILVRDVEITSDEPVARGGTNLGPAPTELVIAGLVSCTNVVGQKCAAKHGVHFQSMEVDAEWQFDNRGTTLQEEVEIPFPEVTLNIRVTTDANDAAMEKVKEDLPRYCAVSKTLENAGSKIIANWTVVRP